MLPILSSPLAYEHDVVSARQRARQIAGLLGFDSVLQTRVATAVSEIARNAFEYARGGKVEFLFDEKARPQVFIIRVTDTGEGIPRLQDILDGRYQSPSGMGLGIIGTRRLMESFDIQSAKTGTVVTLGKALPKKLKPVTGADIARIAQELMKETPRTPLEEMQQQNRELMSTLQELEKRQAELGMLNQELAETNSGVVALYAELDERAEHSKRADEVKTRFLSHMSHEFRTPVNSVLSLTGFLLDRADGELTPEQEKQVKLIRRSMESLSVMINDLLDLAKVEAGKITVRPDEFTVTELFGSLRGMFKPMLSNPKVALHFEKPAGLPSLHSDEGKVAQILRNFISNALKFTEVGEVRVKAAYDKTRKVITFTVSDTGIGIEGKGTVRIFEEFSQIENPQQKKHKGTGLGLPLSRKLAELLGGGVEVESTPGKGSAFSVSLPVRYEAAETATVLEKVPGNAARVLIIDDDEASYYALQRALVACGCEVHSAPDGFKGLRMAKEDNPDVIFLDLMMPDLNGFEVLERLKQDALTRDIPVIIHSTKLLSARERSLLESQAHHILSKTTEFDAIIRYLKEAMPHIRSKESA